MSNISQETMASDAARPTVRQDSVPYFFATTMIICLLTGAAITCLIGKSIGLLGGTLTQICAGSVVGASIGYFIFMVRSIAERRSS